MAFDALVLNAVSKELEEKLIKTGNRISRIYQLNSTDMIFYFKGEEKRPLFFSIHTNKGRINFTNRRYIHPDNPPSFCMLLRKHLSGGYLVSLEQPPLERVLFLHFSAVNESGREAKKTLTAEIMGRHSNLLLLDTPDEEGNQVILGTLKPVSSSLNRMRTLLPRHIYHPPPAQEKLHPYALNFNFFNQEIERLKGQPTSKFLLENIQGLSPFLAREIAGRAQTPLLSEEASLPLWKKLEDFLQTYQESKWEPTLLNDHEGKPLDYTVINTVQTASNHKRKFNSVSILLDEFYEYRETIEEKENLSAFLFRNSEQALKKFRKKEKIQLSELEKTGEAGYYRQCGELILMNLKQIPEKSSEIFLENVFSEHGEKVKIVLDPQLSPSLNAQRYFKKYRKAQQGEKMIKVQLEQTQNEISYLETVLFSLEQSNLQALREVRDELAETGYLPVEKKHYGTKKNTSFGSTNLSKFISSMGEEIFVGRNNRQNDYLIHHFAIKTDLWFHVKDMPGSHVIVRSENPHEKTIKEAAHLAAYFSRGADSSNVPVDYTPVKNVRRIPGAKPGMVTYSKQRTIYVTPHKKILDSIKQQ
ncbi:MAG: NFACT RNA binding domain-containing protein [Bacillota bacterium]|nr:NFACT RNA binding domain-containing protein [Bacillota bacterium]